MPQVTTVVGKPAPKTRSAVSNRTRLFAQTDARSAWGRRYRDLVHDIGRDLGGVETLPELKLALVRRAAALVTECEKLEARLAEGEEVDVDLLGRLTGHTRRLAEILGTDRKPRDVTPSLDAIAARHREGATT